jgi:hypothetical protein
MQKTIQSKIVGALSAYVFGRMFQVSDRVSETGASVRGNVLIDNGLHRQLRAAPARALVSD